LNAKLAFIHNNNRLEIFFEAILNNLISNTFHPMYLFTRFLFNVFIADIAFNVTAPNKFAIAVFLFLHNLINKIK